MILIRDADRLAAYATRKARQEAGLDGSGLKIMVRQQRGLCAICGGPFVNQDEWLRPTIDHIEPVSNGGGRAGNLWAAHAICNNIKGSKSVEYAREVIGKLCGAK